MPLYESPWSLRIKNANKYHDTWAGNFQCNKLEDYYKGKQWGARGLSPTGQRPYTLNLVYATIRRKLANMIFTHPEFLLDPRPGMMDWNQDFAVRSAQIKQDALNTIIQNPRMDFVNTIKLAALDSFFRFGVIEVGYSANIMNPMWDETLAKDKNEVVVENEKIYAKWIPARRFRVSMSDDVNLKNCNWCGYYEWISKEVLENTKGINFPKELKSKFYSVDFADPSLYFASGDAESLSGDDKARISKEILEAAKRGELCKVWHIVDNIDNERLLLLDGNYEPLYSESIERIPFLTHRFDFNLEGWYPIPPVWQWLSSQDEINESREQMRRYRRRFNRKFEYLKGSIDPDEIDKLTLDEDGTIIQVKKPSLDGGTAVRAIGNPEIGSSIVEGLIASKDDFNIVSGNVIARGRASDRQTATATRKQAEEEGIVESSEQIEFSVFVAEVGREILLQMGENLEEGMWIKLTSDPGDQQSLLQEIQLNKPIFKYITSQDISDGYDFDIKLNVIDATPAQMALAEQQFLKFLTITSQFPQISLSPTLIRETAYRVGYRNERVIQEMQKMALLAIAEKASMANQSLAAQGLNVAPQGSNGNGSRNNGNFAAAAAEQQTPNSIDEIQSQMLQQR